MKDLVLYNLQTDVAEANDVAQQHPEIVSEMKSLAENARKGLGEYLQRGSGQRPTGTALRNAPVISHEKDWGTIDAAAAEAIAKERQKRHPAGEQQKRKKP